MDKLIGPRIRSLASPPTLKAMDSDRSDRRFKPMGGRRSVDVCDYVRDMKASGTAFALHIGCDSQNHRSHTVYVTTVVFRFPGQEPTSFTARKRCPRSWTCGPSCGEKPSAPSPLRTCFGRSGARVEQIDLDFNTDPAHPSNKVLSASAGYVQSLGFQSGAKPGLLMAAWAADALCQ